jgi:EmrB/QacA subfamily drug resistance transporter
MRRRRLALALVCSAQFVDVLGVTIVVVALPSIRGDLGLSEGHLQWVVSIYALCFGGLLITGGRAADLFGRRRLFSTGIAVFGAASLGCGLADTPVPLIAGRALQGIGAALAVPAALSLLTMTFPEPAERARALAIWTAAGAGGGAAGFAVGGVVTAGPGWRWVFLLNVPIAAATLAFTSEALPEGRPHAATEHLDLAGSVTVTGGLLALIFALTQAEQTGFEDVMTLGVLLAATLLLAAFAVIERRSAEPLVPSALLRSAGFVAANATAFVLTAVTSSAAVLGTLYAQQVRGLAPTTTGLALLPFSVAVVGGSAFSPRLGRHRPSRVVMAIGLVLVAIAMVLTSRIRADGGVGFLITGLTLSGLGVGIAAVASTGLATSAVASDRQGVASGLLNTATQLGTAIGVAAFVTAAAARTHAIAGGDASDAAIVEGFHAAYLAAAVLAGVAAALIWGRPQRSRRRDGC